MLLPYFAYTYATSLCRLPDTEFTYLVTPAQRQCVRGDTISSNKLIKNLHVCLCKETVWLTETQMLHSDAGHGGRSRMSWAWISPAMVVTQHPTPPPPSNPAPVESNEFLAQHGSKRAIALETGTAGSTIGQYRQKQPFVGTCYRKKRHQHFFLHVVICIHTPCPSSIMQWSAKSR